MGYTITQCELFIANIAPIIKKEAHKRGYLSCAAVIAQAIVESAAGTSSLGYKYNNFFGMKCGSKWKGKSVNLKTKEEYKVGVLTTISDNFRVYDSIEDGVAGYYDFISTSRYANLKTATNYKQYAEMLKADGYATSSSYVSTLCGTVTKYNLTKYDNAEHSTLKRGARGPEVKELQELLNHSDTYTNLICDGIFGALTEICVIRYQKEHGLKGDGIVGPKTWAKLQNR